MAMFGWTGNNAKHEYELQRKNEMDSIEKARLEQLNRCIDDIWGWESFLNIGMSEYRKHYIETFRDLNNRTDGQVDLVELDKNNCEYFENMSDPKPFENVYCAEIVSFCDMIKASESYRWGWDVMIWSHGPETVEFTRIHKVIDEMSRRCQLLICMFPFGNCGGDGNITVLYPHHFEIQGFQTDIIGNKDEKNSHVLAWKYIK